MRVVAGGSKTVGVVGAAVAAVLSAERVSQGLPLTQLGRMVGVSQSQLSKQLRGERPLTVDEFARICHALGLDASDVIRQAR